MIKLGKPLDVKAGDTIKVNKPGMFNCFWYRVAENLGLDPSGKVIIRVEDDRGNICGKYWLDPTDSVNIQVAR